VCAAIVSWRGEAEVMCVYNKGEEGPFEGSVHGAE